MARKALAAQRRNDVEPIVTSFLWRNATLEQSVESLCPVTHHAEINSLGGPDTTSAWVRQFGMPKSEIFIKWKIKKLREG